MIKGNLFNQDIFSRRISVYSLVGWFNVEENHETQEYMGILLEIIKHYGTITSKQIANIFGLNENICNNLLITIGKNYPNILNIKMKNNQEYFSINQEYSVDNFKTIVKEKEIRISFGLCSKPLFFIDRFIKPDKNISSDSEQDSKFIFDSLNQVLSNTNHLLNEDAIILPNHLKYQPKKGVFIQGKANGLLIHNNTKNNFDVYINNNPYNIKINESHPDYIDLINELDDLKKQIDLIHSKISDLIKEKFVDIKFEYNIDLIEGFLTINILEDRSMFFGKILHLLKEFDQDFLSFDLNEYWTLRLNTNVNIKNKNIQNKIKFFYKLIDDLTDNYLKILPLNCNEILNHINDKIWKTIAKDSKYVWLEKDFLDCLGFIQDENYSVLLNYLSGRFMERIIFD